MDIYCVALTNRPYRCIFKLINKNGLQWWWQCGEDSITHNKLIKKGAYFYRPKRRFNDSGTGLEGRYLVAFEEGDLHE